MLHRDFLSRVRPFFGGKEVERQVNAGAGEDIVIPSGVRAPVPPVQLLLLYLSMLDAASQMFDSEVVESISPAVAHSSDICQ
jgi:hypothetical protein